MKPRPIHFAIAVLAVVFAAAVVASPGRFVRFFLGFAYRGPLVDVPRWQRWIDANPNLFGPLGETASFAVVETANDSTGLVVTREREGVVVEKSHTIIFRRVPLLLVMSQTTAEELLRLDLREGDKFWDGVKFLVQKKKIVAYANAPRKELDRVGLTGFLQVIDAIPPK